MKNLKIGKKITLSFGLVIAIVAILAVTTVVGNLMSYDNVNKIALDSQLQTTSNDALDSFNAARTQANIIVVTVSEDANASFKTNDDAAQKYFSDIFAYINANPYLESFRETATTTYNYYMQWSNGTYGVIDVNTDLDTHRTALNGVGAGITAAATEVLNFQLESMESEAKSGGAQLQNNILDRVPHVETATEIMAFLTSMRVEMRTFLQTFDTSVLDEILGYMDSASALCEEYRDTSSNVSFRQNVQAIIDDLAAYRALTVEFAELCDNKTAAVASTRAAGADATDSMSVLVYGLDDAMTAQISGTSSTAIIVLVAVIVMVLITLIISVVMARVLTASIVPAISLIKDVAVKVGGTGDLHFTEEYRNNFFTYGATNDETGETIRNFGALIDRLVAIGNNMQTIASKDLTVEVKTLSEVDTMGNALVSMVESLNEMFHEINNVSNEVAASSGEIANGAQLLAQGSTEQASTVQEISASISEINAQMSKNTGTANDAADYGDKINVIANEGTQKLDEMMDAVKAINSSATEIESVIKVIEDIAFQTNILALNAAVEAARAGEHGKGFAVVADEVRNLAAKSAEAAKGTSDLISAAIEKSATGLLISQQTSESFAKIIDGIQHTSESLKVIAQENEVAKSATDQVSMAIEQVSQVVQQNSATSEESAASSEEMSSLANVLQGLIAQFKLADLASYNRSKTTKINID